MFDFEEGNGAEEELERMCDFAQKRVNIGFPTGFRELSLSERRSFLFRRLNRPLRVCGMVKNEGEPGGGPFWVDDPDGKGGASLQIIEESQIDRGDPKQRAVWSSATHFNPVDIVCGVRDFRRAEIRSPGVYRSGDGGDHPEVGEGEGASRAGETARPLERVDGLLEHRLHRGALATFNPVKTVAGSPPLPHA